MKPTNRIQYLLENQGVEQNAFRIDSKTGALELCSMLPPMSMALTVRAILEDGSNQFEAEAVVRVHVVCFVGSHAWDAVRKLTNFNLLNLKSMCHFEFRTPDIHSDKNSNTNPGNMHTNHLLYRIKLRHFGCVVRTNLKCTVSNGAQLANATIGEIGSGMRCPNILIRPTLFSAERNMTNVDLGDLCATGDENSWIDLSVVVSVNDEQKRPFVDCKMFSQHAAIENSRLRYWISNSSEEILPKRERRSTEKITVNIPANIEEVEMNRPKSVQLEIYIPGGHDINNSSLLIICPKSEESNKPQCTVKVLRLSNGEQIKVDHTNILNITEFNVVQQNRVQINFTNIRSSAKNITRDANTITLEIELRATHCMEVENQKTITIQFESRFDEQLILKNATIDVHHKGQPITDLDLKMYINTSDVYPGDTVQINTTLKNTERSQCECKLTMLDLHAGPWVVDGALVDTNKNKAKLNKTDLRRMEIRIEDFVSMDTWNFSVNVRFAEVFDFSSHLRLRILSFTMILYCQLQFPIDKHPWATVHTIEHVILHSERNQFKQLIDHTPSETVDCQVQTWTSAYQTTESVSLTTSGTTHTNKSPFNRRHLTILLGRASDIYYIRINLPDFEDRWFSSHISITSDGRVFSDIGECTFNAYHDNSHICVFKQSFQVRGLRIIPTKPVIKSDITKYSVHLYGIPYKRDVHQFDPCIKPYTLAPEGGPTLPQSMLLFNRSYIRVKDILIICHPVPQLATFSYPRMKCTGLVDGNRLTWFDIGPMISQIITYQNEDKRFFAVGPERSSILSARDLTDQWTAISLSEYRNYIDGKNHTNATYLPWEETRTFNKNLYGAHCAEFTADDWNLCFDGIYYKSKMVAVWTDEAGLQLPSSG
ncbi:hypothetical protein D915_007803 [Fasciola hepatica]|uniref:F5/8 type C domain-containing protein n=1 Tax=Fasciola hepatica TaxID=6192 RepID=A0A4E0RJM7_FASHE|nr:hypothetical protein D915_007803 [Fasciola hepatica]